jgi:hypothetical protein
MANYENSDNILSQFKKETDYLDNIYNQLFDVVKLPYPAPIWQDENSGLIYDVSFDAPKDSFGIYKTSGGKALGTVGSDYAPQQPRLIFESFAEALIDNNLPIEKIEFKHSVDFSKIRFRIPLRKIEFLNAAKVNDITDVYLNIQTGFDGKTKTTLFLETVRLICMNGMKMSQTEEICKFKNTLRNADRLLNISSDIVKVGSKAADIQVMYEMMDNYQITEDKYREYILRATTYDIAKREELSQNSRTVLERIEKSIEEEIEVSGNTMFALYNGITRYTNHHARNNASINPDYIFYGKGVKTNDTAYNVAVEMIAE